MTNLQSKNRQYAAECSCQHNQDQLETQTIFQDGVTDQLGFSLVEIIHLINKKGQSRVRLKRIFVEATNLGTQVSGKGQIGILSMSRRPIENV